MKKNLLVSIFIFLTSLFAGLFFCIELETGTRAQLSDLMLSGMQRESHSFFVWLFLIFISHIKMYLLMIPALFVKALVFIPAAVIVFRSFSLGFCCGLVYISNIERPFIFSLLHLLPQNLFLIPAYVLFAAAVVTFSMHQKNRPLSLNDRSLLASSIICVVLTFAGSLIETVFL